VLQISDSRESTRVRAPNRAPGAAVGPPAIQTPALDDADSNSNVARLLRLPDRYPGRTLAFIGLMFALAYGASLVLLPKPDGRIVMGDAVHHYVQLRSAVFDRDLHFENEYVRLYGLKGGEPETEWVHGSTPTGYVRNYMPVGPALVWSPVFLVISSAIWLANVLGVSYPLDGYGRLFQAAAGFSGIIAATIGSWLAFLTASSLFERRVAIWATLAVWLSSSAIYYSLISPTYSHATSMLAVGAFWLAWTRTRNRQDVPRYAAVGLLVGIAALMRWQDAVLLMVPVGEALLQWRRGTTTRVAARLAACVLGALVAFAPQMTFWAVVYGQPLAIPQGSGFMKWTEPALWSVLFSGYHGLLTWTPVVALALAGLVLLVRRDRSLGIAALSFFVVSWYVNAAVADWWGGAAFGARRFISCYPLFVLGFAALLDRLRVHPPVYAAIAIAFTVHTFLLLVQYQAYMHGLRDIVPYPGGFYGLWVARFRAPIDLVAWWLNR
jgi:hypothetical protein